MKRKLRGKKRYYRRLAEEAENFLLELDGPNDWYDFWHQHFDWQGRGNKSGKERNEHLKAMFTAFEKALTQLKSYQKPYQIWLSISAKRPTNDGLYFHTPNPNQDNFPYLFDDFNWTSDVPPLIAPFMKEEYELGAANYDGDIWYSIRVRENA